MFLIRLLFLAISVVAVASEGACMPSGEPRVAGKTAEEAFKDPKLALLASVACRGDAEAVQREVDIGINPNTQDASGYTPLLWTVYCESARGVEALIKAGADPNYKLRGDKGTFTAVFVATRNVHSDVLRTLLAHGGDPNAEDTEADVNTNSLDIAFGVGLQYKNWDNFHLLLDAGANPNPKRGFSSLADKAATFHRWDKVAELMLHGCNSDLELLGRKLQRDYPELDAEQVGWARKVRDLLEAKGVHFPEKK